MRTPYIDQLKAQASDLDLAWFVEKTVSNQELINAWAEFRLLIVLGYFVLLKALRAGYHKGGVGGSKNWIKVDITEQIKNFPQFGVWIDEYQAISKKLSCQMFGRMGLGFMVGDKAVSAEEVGKILKGIVFPVKKKDILKECVKSHPSTVTVGNQKHFMVGWLSLVNNRCFKEAGGFCFHAYSADVNSWPQRKKFQAVWRESTKLYKIVARSGSSKEYKYRPNTQLMVNYSVDNKETDVKDCQCGLHENQSPKPKFEDFYVEEKNSVVEEEEEVEMKKMEDKAEKNDPEYIDEDPSDEDEEEPPKKKRKYV